MRWSQTAPGVNGDLGDASHAPRYAAVTIIDKEGAPHGRRCTTHRPREAEGGGVHALDRVGARHGEVAELA